MKYTLVTVLVGVVVWVGFEVFKHDTYIGFFYPDASNLTMDIMSQEEFNDIYDCRAWAESMALEHAKTILSHENGWDYECGLNCDISGNKPYVCEETVQ